MLMDTIFVNDSIEGVELAINDWDTLVKASEDEFNPWDLEPITDLSKPNYRAWCDWDCAIVAIRRGEKLTELHLVDVKKNPLDDLAMDTWNKIAKRFNQANLLTKPFIALTEEGLRRRVNEREDYWFLYSNYPELGDEQEIKDRLRTQMRTSNNYERDESREILFLEQSIERQWQESKNRILQRQAEWREVESLRSAPTRDATVPYLASLQKPSEPELTTPNGTGRIESMTANNQKSPRVPSGEWLVKWKRVWKRVKGQRKRGDDAVVIHAWLVKTAGEHEKGEPANWAPDIGIVRAILHAGDAGLLDDSPQKS